MLPASLQAELQAGMDPAALTSLDPVVDSQQNLDRLTNFKRTPARIRPDTPPAGDEENFASLWRPRHSSSSSSGPRPPLVERSANIQFTDKFKPTKKPERRLAFETHVSAANLQASSAAQVCTATPKTFAQATMNTNGYENLSKKATFAAKSDNVASSAEADAIACALANTDFSLWSSSRLPPAYPSTGALPLPIKHHAPPSQDGISNGSVNTDASLDANTLACWCHVQSSQNQDPAPIDTGMVRSLIEQQVQSGTPFLAPWYRHQPRSLPPKGRLPAKNQYVQPQAEVKLGLTMSIAQVVLSIAADWSMYAQSFKICRFHTLLMPARTRSSFKRSSAD